MRLKSAVTMVPLLLLLGAAPVHNSTAAKPQPQQAGWVFEGCFQPPNRSQCYDVYRHNGAYWICRTCGTTGTPNETKCRPMTGYEQSFGLWCS
jgi:ribosomal protein L40E